MSVTSTAQVQNCKLDLNLPVFKYYKYNYTKVKTVKYLNYVLDLLYTQHCLQDQTLHCGATPLYDLTAI